MSSPAFHTSVLNVLSAHLYAISDDAEPGDLDDRRCRQYHMCNRQSGLVGVLEHSRVPNLNRMTRYTNAVGETPCMTYQRLRQICNSACKKEEAFDRDDELKLTRSPRRGSVGVQSARARTCRFMHRSAMFVTVSCFRVYHLSLREQLGVAAIR